MRNCNYRLIEIGFRGNLWMSGCKKELLFFAPLGKGVASPPLPTDNNARFCTFCGKTIKLKSLKPQRDPAIPKAPDPEPVPKLQLSKAGTPGKLFPREEMVLKIDDDHDTYEGWINKGFQVQMGQKMVGRNEDGVPLFHRNSVKPKENKKIRTKHIEYFSEVEDFDDDIPF